MLNAILRFCIRERLIVLLLTGVVVGFGWWAMRRVPIDAIPNVGENQVIVFTEWPGRSPKDVEDQVTYPLSVGLLAVPGAESVRGKSLFGYSFVQVTFADDVDFYWARSRVAEQLGTVAARLPEGVTPTLGPDATALGQVLYYVLEPPPGMNLAELRTMQDFVVKYELQAVEGVSEVASVGGYVRQYQIELDPDKLQFQDIPLDEVVRAVRESNVDVGAKTVETTGMEYILRGKGFLGEDEDPQQAVADIEETVVASRHGVPVRVRDLGQVQLGPDFRRGAIDLNGSEAVGGVVVMRHGENPRTVIERVKAKIAQIEPGLEGVTIKTVYDRTGLIDETVGTLSAALTDEILITVCVIFLFLLHVRSSLVVAVTLPIAVLMAFIAMHAFGVSANIMSLAGIAIAIGTMVDMGIIVSENIYQHLAEWESEQASGGRKPRGSSDTPSTSPVDEDTGRLTPAARQRVAGVEQGGEPPAGSAGGSAALRPQPPNFDKSRLQVIHEAAAEVAPAVMTAVATTVVSFLPVLFLTGRDYKLFAPLAWTKTFSLVASLLVAVLLVPALSRLFLKSPRWSWPASLLAGLSLGGILAATCWFVWGDRLAERWGIDPVWATAASFLLGVAGGWFLTREKLRPIEQNPLSRFITWAYEPTLRLFLKYKKTFLLLPTAIVVMGLGAWFGLPTVLRPIERFTKLLGTDLNDVPGYVQAKHAFTGLESDDWIALDEGSWFYMPTLYPAASFSQSMQVLQTQDVLIKEIPEVENVLGKIGRVESALDPAPAAMVETYVMLKPKSEWRDGMTMKRIWQQINDVATLPGVTPASPLQPIEGRVVMLQSGIKAPMAIRIYGDDLQGLAKASRAVAGHLKESPYVKAETVNPDIVLGKPYIEFDVDRETAARYEMTAAEVNQVIETALGGKTITTTVEGRERYPVRIRYRRNLRERIDELKRLPVVTHNGEIVPLQELAAMQVTWGPGAINSENARLVAHVSFATSGVAGDLESVSTVEESLRTAQQDGTLQLPAGYNLEAVGSFQNQIEANRRLMWLVPLVVLTCLFITYLQFRHVPITLAVFAGIPVAFGGGMILLGIEGVEMNTAIWVGFIALFGIAVDDGVVIATYLDQVFSRKRMRTAADIRGATVEAGLRRIRPCLMTTATTVIALLPVLTSTGRGADVARAMALPVFGGMLVELITLFVVPVIYCGYKEFKLAAGLADRHLSAERKPEAMPIPAENFLQPA